MGILAGFSLTSINVWAAKSAMVSIDGAMVYKGPSFDAPVIAYLKRGKKVRVSNQTFGPFYKVRLRPGLTGYISDIDVKVIGGSGFSGGRPSKRLQPFDNDFGEKRAEREYGFKRDRKKPIFATRYIGLTGGWMNYKENVLDQDVSANLVNYGIKATGPNLILDGPMIFDINIHAVFSPPAYYKTLSTTEPTGQLVIVDLGLIFPYHTSFDEGMMLYFGAGPALIYSKFKITTGGLLLDLQDLKLGGSFMAGAAYRIGKFVIKVEPKYVVEKSSYPLVNLSVQRQF